MTGAIVSASDTTLNLSFASLLLPTVLLEASSWRSRRDTGAVSDGNLRGAEVRQKFLSVFWMFKMADWLQGPYLYEVYVSKVVRGRPLTQAAITKLFLSGFCATAASGPFIGNLVDVRGRKMGSLLFAFLYSFAAMSTRANNFLALWLGRICGGVGSGLLASAPEAWLVAESQKVGLSAAWLQDTFALAFLGDFGAAMLSGQVASYLAGRWGPGAPFLASQFCLAGGAAVAASTWSENVALTNEQDSGSSPSNLETNTVNHGTSSKAVEAFKEMRGDFRIVVVAVVQALFEGSMYSFVMQWPAALVATARGGDVPFGKVFSCLMASCMLGSSVFKRALDHTSVERFTMGMLAVASCSMMMAATGTKSTARLLASFCLFEACVGAYFPAMGTMRSRYVPDSHRSIITSLSQVPMNFIVIAVMLGGKRLGIKGSLLCCAIGLKCAFLAQLFLCLRVGRECTKQL